MFKKVRRFEDCKVDNKDFLESLNGYYGVNSGGASTNPDDSKSGEKIIVISCRVVLDEI